METMMKLSERYLAVLTLVTLLAITGCGGGNSQSNDESNINLSKDSSFHKELSEWWYYTGHLNRDEARWGFQVTIFQYDLEESFGIQGFGYMCHVAVTDKIEKEHYHNNTFSITPQKWQAEPPILEVDDCYFELDGDGRDHIIARIPEGQEKDGKASPWQLDLTFEPQKKAVLHGGDGIIPMGNAGGTSWYYSYTRLAATGILTTPEEEVEVTGQAWMDHQWGPFDINDFKGWDWWSMQFEDGWEIMLFVFTNWDGTLASQVGTLIDPEGNVTELEGVADFTITPKRTWESTHTDGIYPIDWDIIIHKLDWSLEVRTSIDDQEMHNSVQNYWEGETVISGTRSGTQVTGIGYTELTGYATDSLDP